MKNFLYQIRSDIRRLFVYPALKTPPDFAVDYDVYWKARGRGGAAVSESLSLWQRARSDLALKFIEPGSSVLDLGSGGGAVLEYLQERRHIRGIGVDASVSALESLRAKGIEAIDCDISSDEAIQALPEVDHIIGFEILEHIPNPERLIYLLSPKAKKSFIFTFPNTGYYPHRLRLLFGRFPLQWVTHPGEHLRFWTVADVRSWVPQLHLHLKYLTTYQGLPFLNRLCPSLFGAGILFVADTSVAVNSSK